jgi:hypothetical protein
MLGEYELASELIDSADERLYDWRNIKDDCPDRLGSDGNRNIDCRLVPPESEMDKR